MQNRDKTILWVAIICGLLAFMLTINYLKKSNPSTSTSHKASSNEPMPIPTGMRALTLSAKDVENIPNLLAIGNYVDILGIVPNSAGKMELQTIIRSAQVISLDNKEANEIKSLTVALTPTGAEVTTKALAQGKIHLIMGSDVNNRGVLQLGGVGFTEVIRGVQKEKNVQIEK